MARIIGVPAVPISYIVRAPDGKLTLPKVPILTVRGPRGSTTKR